MILPRPSIFALTLTLFSHINQFTTAFSVHASPPRGSANITSYNSHGNGCPNGAGAVISPTSQSDNLQILTFYSEDFTLPSLQQSSSKSCNGTISLLYPENFAFKLEGVTYYLLSGLEPEVNAYFTSAYSLWPGTGIGKGVIGDIGGEMESASITHKWQFNGTGRAQRKFRYYSLPEMVKPSGGEVAPVLSSLCGRNAETTGKNNTVQVGIDTLVGVHNTSNVIGNGSVGDGPAFELEMVQLHLRWEACK